MKWLGFSILVLATACSGAPDRDPRHADVVVESAELESAVSRGTSWWYEATASEVAFSVVGECSPERVCERIRVGELPSDQAGDTTYPVGHPEDSTTTISGALERDLVDITVAHELGHVLGLAHDDGVMSAVMQHATWALPSEWSRAR